MRVPTRLFSITPRWLRVRPRGTSQSKLRKRQRADWSVDLGPRADANPLAREIRRRIVANLQQGTGLRAFRRMWGTVVIVAVSEEPAGTSAHTTLTLRFDWGRLMIHEGRVGRPDVTLWGSPESILALGSLGHRLRPVSRLLSLPFKLRDDESAHPKGRLKSLQSALASVVPAMNAPAAARGHKLKVYGAVMHLRFMWRLARVLANGEP